MVLFPFIMVIWLAFMAASLLAIGMTIWSLIDAGRAPDAAFGPPWDNAKSPWMIGMALAFVVPFGVFVVPFLWWTQGHKALRSGQQVPRPFWSTRPNYPYPQPYPQPYSYPQPPVPPGQRPDGTGGESTR